MSQPKSLLLFLLFSSVVLQGGHAQDLNQTIIGCDPVGCPIDNGDTHCTVTNITFQNIGLTRIPDVPDSLTDFSVVKGVNISGRGSGTFTSLYYLGTPENVNLNEQVHGCAVIFHDPPQESFRRNGTHTCSEVISQSCIDAIQSRSTSVAKDNSDNDDDALCSALQDDLEKNRISECENMTGDQKYIGNVSVQALSRLQNINGSSNSTSDCWPILPKSANLAQMFSEVVQLGILNESTALPELYRISPLLTVFVKGANGSSIVNRTVSRLSCICINATQTVARPGMSPNSGSRFTINAFAAIGGAFALLVLMM